MAKDETNLSRRRFMQAAGATGLGLMLSGPSDLEAAQKVGARPFGKTGDRVSMLSLGMMFDTMNNQIVLRKALSLGVTHWDTANSYGGGQSEEGLGAFFERFPQLRKKIYLVTKSGRRSAEGLQSHLELSLERMRTDYVDLFFVHSISRVDGTMEPEMAAWADKAKAEGKIRHFGFSTHYNMEECLLDGAKLGYIDAIMFSYNFRLMHEDQMRRAVDACYEKGIALTAMKTQGGGPVETDSQAELKLAGRFVKQGYTPGQAKLKAVWQDERIAAICSQMPNISLLKENAAAAMDQSGLSRSGQKALREHAQSTKAAYCAGCTALCEGALNHQVPVGEVMRFLMYHGAYGETRMAKAQFQALSPESRQRLARADYAAAEKVCPNGLPIGRLMRRAQKVFA